MLCQWEVMRMILAMFHAHYNSVTMEQSYEWCQAFYLNDSSHEQVYCTFHNNFKIHRNQPARLPVRLKSQLRILKRFRQQQ